MSTDCPVGEAQPAGSFQSPSSLRELPKYTSSSDFTASLTRACEFDIFLQTMGTTDKDMVNLSLFLRGCHWGYFFSTFAASRIAAQLEAIPIRWPRSTRNATGSVEAIDNPITIQQATEALQYLSDIPQERLLYYLLQHRYSFTIATGHEDPLGRLCPALMIPPIQHEANGVGNHLSNLLAYISQNAAQYNTGDRTHPVAIRAHNLRGKLAKSLATCGEAGLLDLYSICKGCAECIHFLYTASPSPVYHCFIASLGIDSKTGPLTWEELLQVGWFASQDPEVCHPANAAVEIDHSGACFPLELVLLSDAITSTQVTQYGRKTYYLPYTLPALISWTMATERGFTLDVESLTFLVFHDPACWIIVATLMSATRVTSKTNNTAGRRPKMHGEAPLTTINTALPVLISPPTLFSVTTIDTHYAFGCPCSDDDVTQPDFRVVV